MALTTTNYHTNEPRGGQARGAVEQANAITAWLLSHPTTAAGVATGTTTSKVKTANTLTYRINGAFKSKAATDDFWTLSGTTVPAGSFQKYALLIDGSGAASVQEATSNTVSAATVVWTNVSQLSPWAPFLSMISNTKACVGVLTIATDATHTFVPGTTLLGATGITATFIDGIDAALLPTIGNETGLVVGNGG